MMNFLCSLYILDISPLLDVGLVKNFFQSVGCRFVLLSYWICPLSYKSFPVSWGPIYLFLILNHEAGVLFRKFPPVPMSSRLFPTFSSLRFSVSGFMFRSLIHLDLSFVQGDKYGSIFIFSTYQQPVRPSSFVEDAFFFPLYVFHFLCQRSSDGKCVVLFLGLQFYSIDQPVCLSTNTIQFLSLVSVV